MSSHTKNKAAEAQARFNELLAMQTKTTSESASSNAPPPQSTAANAQFVNGSVKSNAKTNNTKKQIGQSMAQKADARREAETPAITQANLQQQPLFNLGF